jgi:crotonobetainyl-CoA:carnitine CoA-transferase CaiB-like acyl-CoA transferase
MVDLLNGICVLSFNHFLMGPVGVQFLADIGVARKLVATADVLAENFKPGVLDKPGLGFVEVLALSKS